jgi:hypothetical protein
MNLIKNNLTERECETRKPKEVGVERHEPLYHCMIASSLMANNECYYIN